MALPTIHSLRHGMEVLSLPSQTNPMLQVPLQIVVNMPVLLLTTGPEVHVLLKLTELVITQ